MKYDTEKRGFTAQSLSVSNHRNRIGCDICKNKNTPTECFIGYCGNVLWICHKCFEKITAFDVSSRRKTRRKGKDK